LKSLGSGAKIAASSAAALSPGADDREMFVLPLGWEGSSFMSPAFDPQAVKALAAAYDDACAVLHVVDRADPRATIVAKKIIEHAQHGERDPIRLRDLVLIELQSNADTA
jgi:hypothetical protein